MKTICTSCEKCGDCFFGIPVESIGYEVDHCSDFEKGLFGSFDLGRTLTRFEMENFDEFMKE